MSTTFREPAQPAENTPEPEKNIYGAEGNPEDFRPIEDDQDLLEALGVGDDVKILPKEDYEDLQEFKDYLDSYMEEKGLPRTFRGMQKGLESLKEEVGLHEEADPQIIIKRIGSIAKSWKELSFIRDFDQKRKILMELITAKNPKEMNEIVFKAMNERKIWQ